MGRTAGLFRQPLKDWRSNARTFVLSLSSFALVFGLALSSAGAQTTAATICKDGTTSAVSGKGACSSHGGVDAKATAAAKQVTCADGSASKSGRGACSGHGGVKSVLPWTVRLRHCATGFVRATDLQRRQSNLVRGASLPRRQPNRDGLVRGQRRLARGSRRRARLRRREAPAKEDADSGDREHPSDDTDDPSRNVLRRFDRDDLPRGISASAGAIRARFVNAPVRCFRDGGPFPSFRSPT
jgi:hypothetical protein